MAVVITTAPPDEGIWSIQALKNRDMKLLLGSLAFDSSYQVGGEDLSAQIDKYLAMAWVIVPPYNGFNFQYDLSSKLIKVYAGGGGFEQFGYSDIKGSANTDAETADSAALPTNGSLISTAVSQTDVRTALGVLVIAAQPDIPRNVCITVTNDTGGNLNMFVGTTSFTVVGTYLGAPQNEVISFTCTDGQKAVAHAPSYRYKYGLKPFSTITSITEGVVGQDMAGTLKISAGLGSKAGIPGAIAATTDVLQLSKNAAALATAGIVDATYRTINFGALADGDDIAGTFRSTGELGAATDLSALTAVPFFAFGY